MFSIQEQCSWTLLSVQILTRGIAVHLTSQHLGEVNPPARRPGDNLTGNISIITVGKCNCLETKFMLFTTKDEIDIE